MMRLAQSVIRVQPVLILVGSAILGVLLATKGAHWWVSRGLEGELKFPHQ